MATVLTDNAHYSAIASAIRGKNGLSFTYRPSEMAAAIAAIPTGGGSSLGPKSVYANGTYYAVTDGLDGYSSVDVAVPNTFSAADEGKVVVSGALAVQTQLSVSVNGTYDTTTHDEVVVSVEGAGIADFIEGKLSVLYDGAASYIAANRFRQDSTIEAFEMPNCVSIGEYAFNECRIVSASFPTCEEIGSRTFQSCAQLADVYFPTLQSIGAFAFVDCSHLTSVELPSAITIGNGVFQSCSRLQTASFPLAETVPNAMFSYCGLTDIYMPNCSRIGNAGFSSCYHLKSINFPKCSTVGSYAFRWNREMSVAYLPVCEEFSGYAFSACTHLVSLYLTGVSAVPTAANTAFMSTPIWGYSTSAGTFGYVYVPGSLYEAFCTAATWSNIASRIVSMTAEEIAALEF